MFTLFSILSTAAIGLSASITRPPAMELIIFNEEATGTEICSSAGALATNFSVALSTDTPAKGENVTTTFDFTLSEPVSDGTAYYSATLNGFGPYTSEAPLCDEVAKSGDPCPMAAGYHHQESVAASTVSGKLITTITWRTGAGKEILCTKITMKTV